LPEVDWLIHAVLRLEQPVKVIWFSGVEPVRSRMDPEKPGELPGT
jgi:hypothetical protein